MTRRCFLRLLAGLPLLTGLPFSSSAAAAPAATEDGTPLRPSIGRTYSGEELHYDIAFSFLGKVAAVRMAFAPAPGAGRYLCILEGETVGVVGFLTRYRKDTYRTLMEELDGGARLRSLRFEEHVRIGQKSRQRIHTFDHGNRRWVERSVRTSGAASVETHDIPKGQDYNDFLTAAYNFRYGVYGAVERGKTYRVPVFPKKDVTTYEVRVATPAEEGRLRLRGSIREGSEYRIDVAVDPEILNSKQGLVKGWLAKELYPVEGVIEDIFLFGDVHGTLARRVEGSR